MSEKKPVIIANWKMKLGGKESQKLALAIKHNFVNRHQVVVCPSFLDLISTSQVLKNSSIKLGAQDCFWEAEGAFTGEIYPKHLKEAVCVYVILGPSVR